MRIPRAHEDDTLPCQRRPELFLLDDSSTQRVAAAKFHCQTCPLMQRCADWGVRHEKHLVWGGMSPEERDAVREARGIVVESPTVRITRDQFGKAS